MENKSSNSDLVEPISLGPWGGSAGTTWRTQMVNFAIKQIIIAYGHVIDSILFKHDDDDGIAVYSNKFGGNGGDRTEKIVIDWPDEYLTTISGHYDAYFGSTVVTSLCFFTNRARYGPFGRKIGTSFSLPMEGGVIVGFHGSSSKYVDAIGVYVKPASMVLYSKMTEHSPEISYISNEEENMVAKAMGEVGSRGPGPWGGPGGKPWDDGVFFAIKRIYVLREDAFIHSIQIEYLKRDGTCVWSHTHGSRDVAGCITNTFKLDIGSEHLTFMTGYFGTNEREDNSVVIRSLSFYTNKGKYGPFGDEVGTFFTSTLSTNGKVVGFHGRSGAYLDALGVYMEYF